MLIVTVICFAFVVLFLAARAIVHDYRDVSDAAKCIPWSKSGGTAAYRDKPFCKMLARYFDAYSQAIERHALGAFDVESELGEVRRAAGLIGASVRAFAGVLILCGLLVTLVKLQGAVGGLKSAFDQLASQQSNMGSSGSTATQVVGGMSTVASAAHDAFLISFCAIFCAATLLLAALWLHSRAARVVSSFSEWAYSSYREEVRKLPEQVPLNVVAAEFKASAQALERLTTSFGEMTESFRALEGFAGSMDHARNAIVDAMQKLPGHIQASMGTLTEQFVRGVTEGLRNTNEHTERILLIYGQQQQRIEKIQAEVVAIRDFSHQVAQAIAKLDGLPEQVAAVATGVETGSNSLKSFESTVAELAIRVEDLPIAALRAEVAGLAGITEGIKAAVASVEHFGEQVAANTDFVRGVPGLIQGIDASVNKEAENAVAFRASVDVLAAHVKSLPVPELRAGIAGLTTAAAQFGNIHAQTIAGLAEITHRSAAFESAAADLRGRIDEVLKYSNRLAIHQQQIKEGADDNAPKIAERLVQLAGRLQREIQELRDHEQLKDIEDAFTRLGRVVEAIKVKLDTLRMGSTRPDGPLESAGAEVRVQN
jgi:hypothetical protein